VEGPRVSIVIPVLNEAALMRGFLGHLRERAPAAELVVVDGGSSDATVALAQGHADRILESAPGRAPQMNAGAEAASGKVLWFLHADSRLPAAPLDDIREALADSRVVGGCFRLRIAARHPVYRISDRLGNLGVDLFRIALGDHGIFCRRGAFDSAGGYPDVPLLEDAELYRRLGRVGAVRQVRRIIETSPRRYERCGPARTTVFYAMILLLYAAGRPPAALLPLYHRLGTGRHLTAASRRW